MNFKYTRLGALASVCGLFAGFAAAIFLWGLAWVTQARIDFPWLLFGLPLTGFLIGYIDHRYWPWLSGGNHLIIDEIHEPKNTIPLRMAPMVLLGTLMTHLFGGSAGREGTAVQMGASLADHIGKFFKVSVTERKVLLMAGAGAGFGAALGTPIAGVIFGMEVIHIGKIKIMGVFECTLASFVAYGMTLLLKAPHSQYPSVGVIPFDVKTLFAVIVAGVIFGLAAKGFSRSAHAVEKLAKDLISYPPFRPMIFGLMIVGLYYVEGSFRFSGLGIPVIQSALTSPSSFLDPIFKTLFTVLTVGSGFKGGEFIPLVFIGTTLGGALSSVLPASLGVLASVGFAAVFGAASKTPIACAVMAMEVFGIHIGPYALIGCYVAYLVSGSQGIYKTQRVRKRGHRFF